MALLLGSTVYLSVMPPSDYSPPPLPRRMSAPGLTSEAQLRYILQWFGEFSELQREDFLPVLAASRSDQPDQLAASMANISCDDKPVSLFQCRMKLFNEWYPTWAEEEQDRLIKGVSEADPDFGTKLQDRILNGPPVNGDQFATIEVMVTAAQNGTNEPHSPPPEEEQKTEENEARPNDDSIEPPVQETADENPVVSDNIPVEIAAAS